MRFCEREDTCTRWLRSSQPQISTLGPGCYSALSGHKNLSTPIFRSKWIIKWESTPPHRPLRTARLNTLKWNKAKAKNRCTLILEAIVVQHKSLFYCNGDWTWNLAAYSHTVCVLRCLGQLFTNKLLMALQHTLYYSTRFPISNDTYFPVKNMYRDLITLIIFRNLSNNKDTGYWSLYFYSGRAL